MKTVNPCLIAFFVHVFALGCWLARRINRRARLRQEARAAKDDIPPHDLVTSIQRERAARWERYQREIGRQKAADKANCN